MYKRIAIGVILACAGLTAFLLSEPASSFQTGVPDEDCLSCHSEPEEVGEENVVTVEDFSGGPHIEDNEVFCISCHAAAEDHMFDPGPLESASCEECHDDVVSDAGSSVHSTRRFKTGQPDCYSCHGAGHAIRYSDDEESPAGRLNQVSTCGACHEGEVLDNFMKSVHGQRLAAGEADGPTCSICHGAHDIQVADIERNTDFEIDVLMRCGGCHEQEFAVYKESIHGAALLEMGVYESASCASCHSSHQILPPTDPESTVFPTTIIRDCEACHADAKLIRRFGLPSDVVRTYRESYHGRATGFGDTQVANCASCHDHHAIFQVGDLRSSVHPANLTKTCGECHPGANENFIAGKVHVAIEEEDNYLAWLIANFYTWLIILLVGGMLIHNGLDFVRKMIIRSRQHKSEPHVIRMTGLERFLHAMLGISFILLAYTGFALLYPDAWWVAPLNWISASDEFRANLHRICGVVLTFVAIHHLWFLFFHRRGREQRRQFMPRLRDFRDFKDNILFYFGRRAQRPRFGRFSYMEKVEYWALVWGTAVMVVTGFILWFEDIAMLFMPRWLWEVFAVVHLYEAILAVLAIVVWHFYYVMFNPDEAPLALTFLTGRMTYKELSKVHPQEFEDIVRAEGKIPSNPEVEET